MPAGAARAWLARAARPRHDRGAVDAAASRRRRSTSRSPPPASRRSACPTRSCRRASRRSSATGMAARATAARRHRRRAPRRRGTRGLGTRRRRTSCVTINAQDAGRARRRALGELRAAIDRPPAAVASSTSRTRALLHGRARALRLRRRLRPAGDRGRPATTRRAGGGVPLSGRRLAAARARRVRPRLRGRGHARATRSAGCRARRPAPLGAQRHVHGLAQAPPGRRAVAAHVCATPAQLYHGGDERKLAGEGRRPLAQRHAAGHAPGHARRRDFDPAAPGANDFRYARRPRRAALPARRAHPPLQPARRARLRGHAELPPPHDPPRDALRRAAARGRHARTTAAERGLVFVCFHASISRQFEGVQVPVAQRRQHLRPRPRHATSCSARPTRRAAR